eukprot:1528491-Prymnesium_polylepis.1
MEDLMRLSRRGDGRATWSKRTNWRTGSLRSLRRRRCRQRCGGDKPAWSRPSAMTQPARSRRRFEICKRAPRHIDTGWRSTSEPALHWSLSSLTTRPRAARAPALDRAWTRYPPTGCQARCDALRPVPKDAVEQDCILLTIND